MLTREQLTKSITKSRIEKMIDEGIDTTVCAAHPLGDWNGDRKNNILQFFWYFPLVECVGHLNSGKCDIKRKPRHSESSHNDSNHYEGAVFTLLQLTNSRLNFVRQLKTWNFTRPDATTYKCVTHDDNQQRNDVTKEKMSDEKVRSFHPRLGPHFNAKLRWCV